MNTPITTDSPLIFLSRIPWQEAYALQMKAQEEVLAGGSDRIFILEHEPIVTLGRRGGVVDELALEALHTPVVSTDRGGLATWHGPGQLVVYPIIHTERKNLSVSDLIHGLGQIMADISKDLGLPGLLYDEKNPGVYFEGKKIGSLGLHLTKRVTTHGFALNINNSLEGFQAIVPCGLSDIKVSTIALETGRPIDMAQVYPIAQKHLLNWLESL